MNFTFSESVVCLSYFYSKPKYRDALVKALLALLEPTRAEIGCLQYELILDNKNPNFLIMLEKFVDQKALDIHERQPYILKFIEEMMHQYCDKVTWNVGKEVKNT